MPRRRQSLYCTVACSTIGLALFALVACQDRVLPTEAPAPARHLSASSGPARMVSSGGVLTVQTLGGAANVAAINKYGQAAGSSWDAATTVEHAVRWSATGEIQDLGTLGGNAVATGINSNGDVCGYYYDVTNTTPHAFVWTVADGRMRDIGTLGGSSSSAAGINDLQQIVGISAITGDATSHGFFWSAGTGLIDVGTLGGLSSSARAINNHGAIAGFSRVSETGTSHAFLWTHETGMQDIDGGSVGGSVAFAINDLGHVAGYLIHAAANSQNRAFLWTPETGMQNIGSLSDASSNSRALNNHDEIVGTSFVNDGNHMFFWSAAEGMVDISSYTGVNVFPAAMNDARQVAAGGEILTVNVHTNSPPVATNVAVSTVTNTAVAVTLAATDPDHDAVAYSYTQPAHGTLSGTAPALTYTPNAGYEGSDSFTFTATDTYGAVSAPATVSITIAAANHAPVAAAGGNDPTQSFYSGAEGAAVAFDGSKSTDADGDALTYSWDFGDGTPASPTSGSATASHVYGDNGAYTATLTVTDTHGASSTATVPVKIVNVAPQVTAPVTLSGTAGQTLGITGSFTDPGAHDAPWTWTIAWGDGATSTGSASTEGGAFGATHAYAHGQYAATVSVTDKDGGTGTAQVQVTAANRPPVVSAGGNNATHDAYTGNEGSAVSFSASATDPDGDALTYSWDFGDGSSAASGASVSHAYADNGGYTAKVTVSDGFGGIVTAPVTVAVANVPPTGTFVVPASVNEGQSFILSVSGVSDPSSADVAAGIQVAFDCGAGFGAFGSATSASCPTTDDAALQVHVSLRDRDGGVTTYAGTVTVLNVPPSVGVFAGADLLPNESYAANGAFTDPGADTWTATVDYGDGSGAVPLTLGGQTFALSHVYRAPGTYTVSVAVTDDDGGRGIGTAAVTVHTPAQVAQNLITTISSLQSSGALNAGQANALASTTNAAIAQMQRGNNTAATNQLGALQNQIEALVRSGRVTALQAQPMLDLIARLEASLS